MRYPSTFRAFTRERPIPTLRLPDLALLTVLLAAGCEELPQSPCLDVCAGSEDTGANRLDTDDPDRDCDGYPASVDCDDSNCFVYPGAPREYNNGRDDDCDGFADTYYGCGETGASGLPLLAGLVGLWRRRRAGADRAGGTRAGSARM